MSKNAADVSVDDSGVHDHEEMSTAGYTMLLWFFGLTLMFFIVLWFLRRRKRASPAPAAAAAVASPTEMALKRVIADMAL